MSTSQATTGVIVIGLGPIGQRVSSDISTRPGFDLLGVVDINPALTGQPLQALIAHTSTELNISPDLASVGNLSKASVAIICTSSKLEVIEPTVLGCLELGLHVVSSCEELLYPWKRAPIIAARIDEAAKRAERSVLGTGINPGFLMDYLPSVLSGLCTRIDQIEVDRVQNATPRRLPFQLKIGSGLSVSDFEARAEQRTIGHMGLGESVELLGHALGLELDKVTESIEPIVSDTPLQIGTLSVSSGDVSGVRQIGVGYVNGKPMLTLRFIAALEHPAPHEKIILHGEPTIEMTIPGGVHGDISTSAVLLNTIAPLLASRPGLNTMASIPATTYR